MSTKKYHVFMDASKLMEKYVGKPTFGMFLSTARSVMDVTQTEMSRIIGVSRSMICDIEKGRQNVSIDLAVKIANKAGLSPKQAIRLCLQDQLRRAKVKYKVEVTAA